MAGYRQNADWSEEDHPRDEDGKFASKPTRVVRSKYRVKRDSLTDSEWRMYYQKLTDIKSGLYVNCNVHDDTLSFTINNKIVRTTYKDFGNEQVKEIYYFGDFEAANEYLNFMGADDYEA